MGKRRYRRIDRELRRSIMRLAAKGLSYRDIVDELDVPLVTVGTLLGPLGGAYRPEQWQPSSFRLSLEERVEIRVGLELGHSFTVIAAGLGRSASTVSREVNANGGRGVYRPFAAHHRAFLAARRPKPAKLSCARLHRRVVADLERLWSPGQIARRLRREFADDPGMQVSHETIYKSLYVQGRGELRRELARCLRSGRAQRRPQGRTERRGCIPDKIMISDRPAEVGDRAVPGHWEGDLLVGKDGHSAIATLVERSTRYVLLARVADKRAETVRTALAERIATLPRHLWRSLTWDQGSEMAHHTFFTVETGVPVYFCDPHSPWQRGSNENTNGLLRQYFPKGTSLAGYTQDQLDAVAVQLNGRPRQTLDFRTPAEVLTDFLAMTS